MTKPKIIVLAPLPPWYTGGVERMVGEICKRLTDTFEVAIWCIDQKNSADHQETYWEGVQVKIFKGYAYALSPSLYNALKKENDYSLIHAHNYSTFIPLIGSLAINKNKPLVINPHFHKKPSSFLNVFLRKFYDPLLGGRTLKRATLIVCNSLAEKKEVQEAFPGLQNIKLIYSGVTIKEFSLAEPFQEEGHIILCVSRLEKYKNVHLAIKALVYLPEDFRLVVVGAGNYEVNLKKLVEELKLNNRVIFTGKISDQDVRRWYRTAAVFVHLSEIESLGLTCIEALAAGTPVVANDDGGGLKETIDLFPDDILAVNVKKDPPERIAEVIRQACKIKVSSDIRAYDWDEIAREFKKTYLQLI